MPNIGTRLKELRRRRDLTVRELALRSGVSHSSISLIERDQISPSVDTLGAILDALGSTLPGFFSELQPGCLIRRSIRPATSWKSERPKRSTTG
jgi:transcriptional regulator with XRE-family HTH domain